MKVCFITHINFITTQPLHRTIECHMLHGYMSFLKGFNPWPDSFWNKNSANMKVYSSQSKQFKGYLASKHTINILFIGIYSDLKVGEIHTLSSFPDIQSDRFKIISHHASGVKFRFGTPSHMLNVDFIFPVINGVQKEKVSIQPSLLEVYEYTMLNKKEGTDSYPAIPLFINGLNGSKAFCQYN